MCVVSRAPSYICNPQEKKKKRKVPTPPPPPPPPCSPPLMVYSEQVTWRRSANDDTHQYLHSFAKNIDTFIVISVPLACLCRVVFFVTFALAAATGGGEGGGGVGRCFLAFCPFSPSDGSRSSSEHDRFVTGTHARNLGHDVRVNYSALHNGLKCEARPTFVRKK